MSPNVKSKKIFVMTAIKLAVDFLKTQGRVKVELKNEIVILLHMEKHFVGRKKRRNDEFSYMKFLGFGLANSSKFSFGIWTSFSKSSQTFIDFFTC